MLRLNRYSRRRQCRSVTLLQCHGDVRTHVVRIHDRHTEILRKTAAAVHEQKRIGGEVRGHDAGLARSVRIAAHSKSFKNYKAGRCTARRGDNRCDDGVAGLYRSSVIMIIVVLGLSLATLIVTSTVITGGALGNC